uniref:permease n=1 Tax=Ningiella ruwaisensis TaxID=2364274 RepID=UPI00109FE863|nr:permease [Ningiella ruwaisensis]
MQNFLSSWSQAATISIGFFWMALWAFMLGYFVSSLIQLTVTRSAMQKTMGKDGPKSIALGSFFGFISSSCSFAALATTKSLFKKGAGLAPSMAFLLASTNLVIELGMVIAVFLGWQFVVGEYVGGVLLILLTWLLIKITRPKRLIEQARERLDDGADDEETKGQSLKETLSSSKGWESISKKFVMEWKMVWKDVLIGFTVAGVIASFVPNAFFEALFIGSDTENASNPAFYYVLAQTVVAPFAAFFTFIGSMGNIPLAAVLFSQGVTFAGVMAFIFSDLVVLPVLRINAKYYGWKMALYLAFIMFSAIVISAIGMHYALVALDALPDSSSAIQSTDREFFKVNYQLFLNLGFIGLTAVLAYFYIRQRAKKSEQSTSRSLKEKIMLGLTSLCALWLTVGLIIAALI